MFDILIIVASFLSIISVVISFFSFRKSHRAVELKETLINNYYKTLGLSFNVKSMKQLSSLISECLDNLIKILSLENGNDLRATVFLLSIKDNEKYAVAFARDSKSMKNREILKFDYPITTNTGFNYILNNPDKKLFIDEVKKPQDAVYYNNINDNWKVMYQSTYIQPIKLEENELIGFLCIDSLTKIKKESSLYKSIDSLTQNTVVYLGNIFRRVLENSVV